MSRGILLAMVLASSVGCSTLADHSADTLLQPVRAVFLAPYAAQVDAHELVTRFEYDAVVVGVSSAAKVREFGIGGHYWPELMKDSEEIFADIRRALGTDWEVVVMCNTPPWSSYPEDIRRSILTGVAAGKALVIGSVQQLEQDLANGSGPLPKKSEMDLGRFPFDSAKDGSVLAYNCGRGRVVAFPVANDARLGYLLSGSPLQSEYEYSVLRAGWVLARAARPASHDRIASIKGEAGRLAVVLEPATLAKGVRLAVAVHRHDDYESVLARDISPRHGETTELPLPQFPTGEYLAEVRLFDADGAILDWDAVFFTVEGPIKIQQFAGAFQAPKRFERRIEDRFQIGQQIRHNPFRFREGPKNTVSIWR